MRFSEFPGKRFQYLCKQSHFRELCGTGPHDRHYLASWIGDEDKLTISQQEDTVEAPIMIISIAISYLLDLHQVLIPDYKQRIPDTDRAYISEWAMIGLKKDL